MGFVPDSLDRPLTALCDNLLGPSPLPIVPAGGDSSQPVTDIRLGLHRLQNLQHLQEENACLRNQNDSLRSLLSQSREAEAPLPSTSTVTNEPLGDRITNGWRGSKALAKETGPRTEAQAEATEDKESLARSLGWLSVTSRDQGSLTETISMLIEKGDRLRKEAGKLPSEHRKEREALYFESRECYDRILTQDSSCVPALYGNAVYISSQPLTSHHSLSLGILTCCVAARQGGGSAKDR